MPELPDIEAYLAALRVRLIGRQLHGARLQSIFFLRSVDPPLSAVSSLHVVDLKRIGKRIALGFEGDLWAVIHLMIAGRLHWKEPNAKLANRRTLAGFDFAHGTLTVTEAGSKRRASLTMVRGAEQLERLDPGGIDVMTCSLSEFRKRLTVENRTLKRALTDPRIVSGIGNAYSDEILYAAGLSPIQLTSKLSSEQWTDLLKHTKATLTLWRDRLIAEAGSDFPEKVTAFRDDMAVHGRFGKPCRICSEAIQRIRYADNETNYCARCQTGGNLLADRSLSRLLRSDWPRTLDELEAIKRSPGTI